MTASLLVAGYEMLGAVTNPEYRLAPGFEFGQGEPDQTVIASLYLDGDTVSGERTANRTITLPVTVMATNPVTLAAKVDTLISAVSASTFQMQWTPDGGLPVVFDCSRAVWSRPARSLVKDAAGLTNLLLTFKAKPFGRSPDQQSISQVASLQVDSFDTAPTGATLDTTLKFEGTGSASVTLTNPSGTICTNTTPVSRSFAAKNLSTYSGLSIRFYQATVLGSLLNVTIAVTLASSGGSTRYVSTATGTVYGSWTLVNLSLSSGTIVSGSGVDLTAVTSESITINFDARQHSVPNFAAHLDDLRATAGSVTLITSTRGIVLAMPAILGSARSPMSVALSGTTMATAMLHSPPVDQDSNAAILIANAVAASPSNVTATVAGANSGYLGTYGLWLGASAAPSGANTVTVTVTQLENAVSVATKVITVSYTGAGPTGRLIPIGQVTLPLRATPTDNTLTSYTFGVNHTAGTDTYSDILLTDTRGQTITAVPPTAAPTVYVDEPSPLQSAPTVYASAASLDRTRAYGIMDGCWITGGPIIFQPGSNKLLVWADAAAPTVTATYYPRWLDERVA